MNSNGQGIDKDKRILDYERVICYEDMQEYLDILSMRYDNMNITSIGLTVLGKSIPMITFGNGKKEILYIGCINGCDYTAASLLLHFVNEYCELRKNSRRIYNLNLRSMEETRTLHIIPMFNPDGVSYSVNGISEDNPLRTRLYSMNNSSDFSSWCANARGVDLDRNFNVEYIEYKKQEGSRSGGAPKGFSGVHPESEPESGAFAGYMRYNDKIKLVLNISCGNDSVSYIEDDVIQRSKSIAQSLSRISGKPLVEATPDSIRGSLIGWCGKVLGIPSYKITCGNGEPGNTEYFQKYAGIREMLFSAPVLT